MKQALMAALLLMVALALPARAQDRVTLGEARLFTNDLLGDGHDRWRSGSYTFSRFRGPAGADPARAGFGAVLEYRLRAEIIAPQSLTAAQPDRRYAGVIAPGLITHYRLGGVETAVGAELVLTGPDTGLWRFQRAVHQAVGLDTPDALADQMPNGIHPTIFTEFGRPVALGPRAQVRPFFQAQAGVETFARVGADLMLGVAAGGGPVARDPVTGHRLPAGPGLRGAGLVLGADVARVFDSRYLPEDGGPPPADHRARLRAGLLWQGGGPQGARLFTGLTWLGPEYDGQPEGQVVGSIHLALRF